MGALLTDCLLYTSARREIRRTQIKRCNKVVDDVVRSLGRKAEMCIRDRIMADPEAPESLRIAARIELEKAQKFNLEAEAARTATDKPV